MAYKLFNMKSRDEGFSEVHHTFYMCMYIYFPKSLIDHHLCFEGVCTAFIVF